jgi:hypothetical protein
MLSRGGVVCYIGLVVGPWPKPSFFDLMPSSDGHATILLAATHYQDAMCVAAWSDLPKEASIGTLSLGGGDDTFYLLPMPSQLLVIHIIIKALASMDDQNNT